MASARWVTGLEQVHEQRGEVGLPPEPFPAERGHVTFPRGPEHAELAKSSPWQAVRAGVPGARAVRVVRPPGGRTGHLASGSPGEGGGLLEAPKLIGLRRRGWSPAHRLWGRRAQTQELRPNLSAQMGKGHQTRKGVELPRAWREEGRRQTEPFTPPGPRRVPGRALCVLAAGHCATGLTPPSSRGHRVPGAGLWERAEEATFSRLHSSPPRHCLPQHPAYWVTGPGHFPGHAPWTHGAGVVLADSCHSSAENS